MNDIADGIESLIEQTEEGWWAPKGDRKLFQTRNFGRLEGEDYDFIAEIRKHIVAGSVAVDVGAGIGDHTVGYLEECGPDGIVLAYEPHPIAFECLRRNVPEALRFNFALGDREGPASLFLHAGDDQGSSYLTDDPSGYPVRMTSLDLHLPSLPLDNRKISLIKVDAEGSDFEVLSGGLRIIEENRPVLVVEVNGQQLARRNRSPRDISQFLESVGYSHSFFEPDGAWDAARSNVICMPR